MAYENVMNRFMLFSGLNASEAAQWEQLVRDAAEQLKGRLRSESDEDDIRFETAASALACCKYKMAQAISSKVESFSAGDVSVKLTEGAADNAWEFYRRCLEDCGELFSDNEFVFMTTREG